MKLDETFGHLFHFLKSVNYTWDPQTPDQILKLRKSGPTFDPLIQYFGLGLDVNEDALIQEGMSPELIPQVRALHPAISRCGSYLISHHHWMDHTDHKMDYVYYGQETLRLIQQIHPRLDHFVGKKVLDLGSGSGALSFEIASLAENILGLEISQMAVDWANASVKAHGLDNVRFVQAEVGSAKAENQIQGLWDIAVFNPPMIIPRKNSVSPYRDGGKLGIELPLQFLEFSERHLQAQGEVFCLVTNPMIQGQSVFFEKLKKLRWKVLEKRCLHSHFNHGLYRKDDYSSLGVQRVELWFLHLIKA